MFRTDARPKQDIITDALKNGQIQLYIDATKPSVKLPNQFLGDPKVPINLSWAFRTPIEFRESGIFAILSFDGQNQDVMLPWNAIWMMVNHGTNEAYLFPDAIPDQIKYAADSKLEQATPMQTYAGGGEQTPPRKGHLKLLN